MINDILHSHLPALRVYLLPTHRQRRLDRGLPPKINIVNTKDEAFLTSHNSSSSQREFSQIKNKNKNIKNNLQHYQAETKDGKFQPKHFAELRTDRSTGAIMGTFVQL